MDKKHSKNAPGLKYIIILFLMLGLSIFIYIYWYSIVSKSSKNHLIKFRQDFTNQEIEIKWNQILTTGFPYRIEHDLNNMEVKFKNVFFKTKSLKLINQPWNLRHFIIKIENDIIINNNIKNIKITNNNLISSLIFENNLNKRISIQSDMLRIFFAKFSLEFNKPELYSRKSDVNNNEIYFYANKLIYRKANNLELKNINIHTYLLNVTKFNVKNTKDWLTNEGGIEINNFSLLIDN